MSYFQYSGNNVYIASDNTVDIRNKLDPLNYILKYNEMQDQFYLEITEPFKIPSRLYGDINDKCKRVLITFNSRDKSTGLLLSGEKGAGKTQLAKLICVESNLPVIIINESFGGSGLNQFITLIDQECIILFDEFEKNYKKDKQEPLLTLFDGLCVTKKLFILTCNNRYALDGNLINRPGRLYYHYIYEGLTEDFIREYCSEHSPKIVEAIISLSKIVCPLTFDILQAIVEECNRYSITPIEALDHLNIETHSNIKDYSIKLERTDHKPLYIYDKKASINIFKSFEIEYKETEESLWTELWLDMVYLTKETNLYTGTFIFEKDGFKVTLQEVVSNIFNPINLI